MTVRRLGREEIGAANDVLCAAFAAYPVMRYVLAECTARDGLRRLVELFTAGRWMREHPIIGEYDAADQLVGAITLTPPGELVAVPALTELGDRTWSALGAAARRRYDAVKAAWTATAASGARWHVNMLGVLPAHRGKGHGEALFDAARAAAGAAGLDLTTEDEGNLAFYRRRGFDVAAHAEVGEQLFTWTLVSKP
jgi:ribosomal protein S18 acetylase RimI-like enzyme